MKTTTKKTLLLSSLLLALSTNAIATEKADATKCSNPVVELTTSMGKIDIELNQIKAPISTANFLNYVNSGFYNGKIFHRVIPGFMVQGGGFDSKMNEATNYKAPIKNEANNGLSNARGTIAMARTNDPDSATAQFFINSVDNKFLDYSSNNAGYAVFGHVIQGMDVVDKISAVKTEDKSMYQNVPVTPVVIISAKKLSCGKK